MNDNKNVIAPNSSYVDELNNIITYEAYVSNLYEDEITGLLQMSDDLIENILEYENLVHANNQEVNNNEKFLELINIIGFKIGRASCRERVYVLV